MILPPFVLTLRNDICNLLVWLYAGSVGSKIDGSFNGEDISARPAIDDRLLIKPDGSIDFKDIFDPNVASLLLECLKSHFKAFTKLLLDLFWERFGEAKEFLID